MFYVKHILYMFFIPIFFCATSWEVKKRVFTNMYLTFTKLGEKLYIEKIQGLIIRNFSAIIKDRLFFVVMFFPIWLLKKLVVSFCVLQDIGKFNQVISEKQGIIVFSGHIGPYYLVPIMLAMQGMKVTVVEGFGFVMGPIASYQAKRINFSIDKGMFETTSIYEKQLLRKLKRRLEEGRIIFIMGDYWSTSSKKQEYVNFFGYDIIPGVGIGWLHKRTGAPIFPIFFKGDENKKFVIKILDQLNVNNKQSIKEITQVIYNTLQQQILLAPEKWALWLDYHLMLAPNTKEKQPII